MTQSSFCTRSKYCLASCIIPLLASVALGQQPVSLIDAHQSAGGWKFGNGPEFPGARGKLELAAEPFRDHPVLSLSGDFTQGGNYVEASIVLPETPVEALSFWVNCPTGAKQLTIRLVDGSEQVHQIRLKIHEKGGWQQLVLPVEEYFKTMGTPAALDIATQYEKWSGANDGKWHQPGRLFVILFSRNLGTNGTVLISDVLLHPSTTRLAALTKEIRLDEMLQAGELDWGFNLGQEFAGAKGSLDLVRDQPEPGQNAMRLHADFTGGGAYVGVRKSFAALDVQAIKVIRMKLRSKTVSSFALRLVDGTDQCHQRKNIPFQADGQWHEVEIVPTGIAGSEHWGGANDGVWHDSVRLMELMLNIESHAGKQPDLLIADLRAEVVVEARIKPAAYTETFDAAASLANWQTAGAVRPDGPGRNGQGQALLLQRSLNALTTATWAASPIFTVGPGTWQVQYAWKAKLHSPDNSYHGSVDLEAFNRAGAVLETIPVGIGYGEHDWQTATQTVTLPTGAAQARFRVQLRKTYGSFWLDDLAAAPLSTGPIEKRVERIKLATEAVGNLFLPGGPVQFKVTVEAAKPLPTAQQVMRYFVRDYWGAEQLEPGEAKLERTKGDGKQFVYATKISIPNNRLRVGKYYELHVAIPQEGDTAEVEYSGFAILPPAISKQFAPEQIPFTIRNWDSRIPVYFDLADRLGLRQIGVWGGWSAKPPYQPQGPGIDRCQKLGAKWITGTPASSIERDGFKEYTEESLRQGMKNFLEQYANKGLAMIAMGNEPHGTGQKVLDNVRAYRAIYETVKAFDPAIHVIGTSVEPNEEYFKAGYQNYLDAYDFHIYEHYSNVRRTIREYRALMEKYHAVKPIHSTELGLNSQGQTRHAVALEMIKKFTVFFAAGGSTVSWFTIQYPDPQGKARGQFGDSHCVFDCKYNLYNPRLDAITYYDLVNGICDKKFVEEQQYPNGVQAYLFRDVRGGCLQVLWRDEGRTDIRVPLPANLAVEVVHVDGDRTRLQSAAGGLSLTVSAEPLMLLYADAQNGLAKALAASALRLESAPPTISEGGTAVFTLNGEAVTAPSLRVKAPRLWQTTLKPITEQQIECIVQAPASTAAREARIHIELLTEGKATGELAVPLRVTQSNSR